MRLKVWRTVDKHALLTGWVGLAVTASLILQLIEVFK